MIDLVEKLRERARWYRDSVLETCAEEMERLREVEEKARALEPPSSTDARSG